MKARRKLAKRSGGLVPKLSRRFALALCVCLAVNSVVSPAYAQGGFWQSIGEFFGFKTASTDSLTRIAGPQPVQAIRHVADTETLNEFSDILQIGTMSRYAGKIWADKTVYANGDVASVFVDTTEGYEGWVKTNKESGTALENSEVDVDDDFLHVFSVLGSSQLINETTPLDVVFVLDVSSSMGISNRMITDREDYDGDPTSWPQHYDSETRIERTLEALNNAIYTLMENNPLSRVGVVLYGSFGRVLLNLDRYTVTNSNINVIGDTGEAGQHAYITVPRDSFALNYDIRSGDRRFTIVANATGSEGDVTLKFRNQHSDADSYTSTGANANSYDKETEIDASIGPYTNQQAGIYLGMQMLANETDTTVETSTSGTVSRIPVMILLTDGGANTLMQTNGASGAQWYDPEDPVNYKNVAGNERITGTGTTKNRQIQEVVKARNGAYLYGNDTNDQNASTGAGVIMATMMTAALGKAAVSEHYKQPDSGAANPLRMYTFSIDATTNTDSWQPARLDAILNPSKNFNGANTNPAISEAFTKFEEWKTNSNALSFNLQAGTSSKDTNAWSPLTLTMPSTNEITFGGVPVSKQDIIDNILYVPEENYEEIKTNSGRELQDAFDQIIQDLSSEAFSTVAGRNEIGASNSLTYRDPIGKYMEVRNVEKMVVFNKAHDVARAAVYDHSFIQKLIDNGTIADEDEFTTAMEGWYKETAEKIDGPRKETEGSWDGWAEGYTYYVSFDTAKNFVPTLENDTAKAQNTVYTFYRLADNQPVRNTVCWNECYGKEPPKRPEGWTKPSDWNVEFVTPEGGDSNEYEYLAYLYDQNQKYLGGDETATYTPGLYKLSDLRIWTEYTGNYIDPDVVESEGAGFDEALFIDVPVNMLPMQVADITLADNNFVRDYSSNTNDPAQSTPLRVFYDVGIAERVRTAGGKEVDLTKISTAYIEKNTVPAGQPSAGAVRFYSNWYNENLTYNNYGKTGVATEYTYGDPVLSFSPSGNNRYYIFQKILPIYIAPDVSTLPDSDGRITEEASAAYANNKQNLTVQFSSPVGTRTLNAVTSTEDMKPEEWYFIPVEYYTGTGLQIYALPRMGSEFGSLFASEESGITAGQFLTWYNLADGDTSDITKAKPTGDADDYWVIAAKIGGVRTGAMANKVRFKTEEGTYPADGTSFPNNNTGTAHSYYMPHISSQTTVTGDTTNLIIDLNLGNNGMLEVVDETLLVTKTVNAHNGAELSAAQKNQEFKYQVYIEGLTGAQEAILVTRNKYAKDETWQRRIGQIKLNVCAHNVLMGDDGKEIEVTKAGVPQADGGCRLYIPSEGGETTEDGYRLLYYDSGEVANATFYNGGRYVYVEKLSDYNGKDTARTIYKQANTDDDHPAGTVEYWIGGVYVVDEDEVKDTETKFDDIKDKKLIHSGDSDDSDDGRLVVLRTSPNSNSSLANITPGVQLKDKDGKVIASCDLEVLYRTETLFFGYKEGATLNEDGSIESEELKLKGTDIIDDAHFTPPGKSEVDPKSAAALANTVEFTLRDGEGYLFTNIGENVGGSGNSAMGYRVTEILDGKNDYMLNEVELQEQNTKTEYAPDGSAKQNGVPVENPLSHFGEYTVSDGGLIGHYYSVVGSTSNYEEQVHYFNYAPEVVKTEPDPGPGENVGVGSIVAYDIYWENFEKGEGGDSAAALLTVTDKLDDGVDFLAAIYDPDRKIDLNNADSFNYDYKYETEKGDLTYPNVVRLDATPSASQGKDARLDATTGTVVCQYGEQNQNVEISYNAATHTVTWTVANAAPDQISAMRLFVRVNESAEEYWNDYDEDTDGNGRDDGLDYDDVHHQDLRPREDDDRIIDRASVKVGSHPEVFTDFIENPTGGPDKTETSVTPGGGGTGIDVHEDGADANLVPGADGVYDGPLVHAGDTIHYEVSWENREMNEAGDPVEATVVITDELDPNVTPTSAMYNPNRETPGKSADYGVGSFIVDSTKMAELMADPGKAKATGEVSKDGTKQPVTVTYRAATGADPAAIIWEIENAAPAQTGTVGLDVVVKEGAVAVGHVDNTAFVKVGGGANVRTKTVRNPTPDQHKTETEPGDGKAVKFGKQIDYKIDWRNYKDYPTTVTVRDPLDPGVDFVHEGEQSFVVEQNGEDTQVTFTFTEVSDGSGDYEWKSTTPAKNDAGPLYEVYYDASEHEVIWTLRDRAPGENGSVTLSVKTNGKGVYTWTPDKAIGDDGVKNPRDLDGEDGELDVESEDWEVRNQATVQVDNDAEIETEIVENPLPDKTETNIHHSNGTDTEVHEDDRTDGTAEEITDPANLTFKDEVSADGRALFEGPLVRAGDQITYEIGFKNLEKNESGDYAPATVVITDALDPNVSFDTASYDTVMLEAPANQEKKTIKEGEPEQKTVTIEYDETEHTVTWTIENAAAQESGTVTLKVTVKTNATATGHVDNGATVQVGTSAKMDTRVIENPTPNVQKTEPNPGDGVLVALGDPITYRIDWRNYKKNAATVIVRDPLDPGVDFVHEGEQSFVVEQNGEDTQVTFTFTEVSDGSGDYEWKSTTPAKNDAGPLYEVYYDASEHEVMWTLRDREPREDGYVTLVVKPNENARKTWLTKKAVEVKNPDDDTDRDPDTEYGAGDDWEVLNQAAVRVDTDNEAYTEIVENPLPDKTETKAGNTDVQEGTNLNKEGDVYVGPLVQPGDTIHYEVYWQNREKTNVGTDEIPIYQPAKAKVVITDVLDPNVRPTRAMYDSSRTAPGSEVYPDGDGSFIVDSETLTKLIDGTQTEAKKTVKKTVSEGVTEDQTVTVTYRAATETNPVTPAAIIWTIVDATPNQTGTVGLDVEVLSGAVDAERVDNTASVQVGNHNAVETRTLENPTPYRSKTEDDPGINKFVKIGEEIDYTIRWRNYETQQAIITVRDPLDPGVDFVADPPENKELIVAVKDGTEIEKVEFEHVNENDPETAGDYEWKSEALAANDTDPLYEAYYDASEHEVTWILRDRQPGEHGYVTLSVKTNEKSIVKWDPDEAIQHDYENDGRDPDGELKKDENGDYVEDWLVKNQATVKVGDHNEMETEIIPNPLTEKTETQIDGDDVTVEVAQDGTVTAQQVRPGQMITYEINWVNSQSAPADVIVTDKLDPAVEFVSATKLGKYNPAEHCVVWTLEKQPSEETGTVSVTVRVTRKAVEDIEQKNGEAYEIVNEATVTVGNETGVTNKVENPVPEKTETQVNGADVTLELEPDGAKMGPKVNLNDVITYEIRFRNSYDKPATVVVTDQLDPGLDFKSASFDGVTLVEGKDKAIDGNNDDDSNIIITYDEATRTVTWTLKDQLADTAGKVELKASVNPNAEFLWNPGGALSGGIDNKVRDQASVQIGNEPKVKTNIMDNPVGRNGSLAVTKTLFGADAGKAFHFTVKLSDTRINGQYGEMEFVNGVAEFTLKTGEKKTARNIPAGVTYEVYEQEANKGYHTNATDASGVIVEDKESVAAFVNIEPDAIPKTGDDSGVEALLALLIASGVCLALLSRRRHVRG